MRLWVSFKLFQLPFYNTTSAEERRVHAFLLTVGQETQVSHLTFTYIQSEEGSSLVGGGWRFQLLLGLPHQQLEGVGVPHYYSSNDLYLHNWGKCGLLICGKSLGPHLAFTGVSRGRDHSFCCSVWQSRAMIV